jgi:hypothetical protein
VSQFSRCRAQKNTDGERFVNAFSSQFGFN